MCAKSQSNTTVPTLHSSAILKTIFLNAQLSHSSKGKIVGIQIFQIAVLLMPIHIPSSPISRINLLSLARTVLLTSQRGQTVMAAGRAKTGVNHSQGIAFYMVSLAIGHRSVHPVAGCNCYLHSHMRRMSHSKVTERWVVCHCI